MAKAVLLVEDGWEDEGDWTYQDYLNLSDDGRRYEIIEGRLYETNAPDFDHQFAVVKIVFQMDHFVSQNNLGCVLTAPFEVHLSEKNISIKI